MAIAQKGVQCLPCKTDTKQIFNKMQKTFLISLKRGYAIDDMQGELLRNGKAV